MSTLTKTSNSFTECKKCTSISCFIDSYGDRHCYICGWIDYKTNRNSIKLFESRIPGESIIATDNDLLTERIRYKGQESRDQINQRQRIRSKLYQHNC